MQVSVFCWLLRGDFLVGFAVLLQICFFVFFYLAGLCWFLPAAFSWVLLAFCWFAGFCCVLLFACFFVGFICFLAGVVFGCHFLKGFLV